MNNHPIHRKAACRGRGAIYALATNPDEVRCVTEDQLDAWWRSQSPEDKAEIYEQRLEPAEESCRYCGCTQNRACVTKGVPCSWLDGNHTVCSAPACAERFVRQMFEETFGPVTDFTEGLTVDEMGEVHHRMRGLFKDMPEVQQIEALLRSDQWLEIGKMGVADATL